ncbi:hypothetical protein Patl1_21970 [Pistacia atlantica]|uniref:Uncharacterized protein n=1 Tax=Pistacia atlantica TaxID=434234 RepID=A0ACC1BL48_9ROSI|nr:hypothetical protein Patl1_21970 [Pistacia atlantica]
MILQLLFQIIFLSWPMISRTQAQALVKPGCPSKCGNITIPFPFGIREGCYIDDWFAIDCDSNDKPFIKRIHLEVLEIFLNAESPFVFSQKSNRFTALGCNNIAYMRVSEFSIVGGCLSTCDKKTKTGETGCYGINCCQTKIPSSLKVFNTTNPQNVEKRTHVPVVLDWGILNSSFNLFAAHKQKGYNSTSSCQIYANFTSSIANSSSTQFPVVHCNCRKGYEGNPYLLKGCQDAQVLSQGRKEEIVAVANLAKRCLNLNGKKRPTMKEVSMELEGIQAWQKEVAVELEGVQASQKDDGMQQTYQEIKYDNTERFEGWDVGSSSTSTFERVRSSSVDVQPLLTS